MMADVKGWTELRGDSWVAVVTVEDGGERPRWESEPQATQEKADGLLMQGVDIVVSGMVQQGAKIVEDHRA